MGKLVVQEDPCCTVSPGPGVVAEQVVDLVVGADVRCLEGPGPGGEGEAGDEEGDAEGVDEAVLLEEACEPLVAAHPEHVLAVCEHVQGAAQPAHHAHQREHYQLLQRRYRLELPMDLRSCSVSGESPYCPSVMLFVDKCPNFTAV